MKLSTPKNQTAEVLFELLTNKSINRRDMMLNTGILNLTARFANIRNKYGINVFCRKIETTNKHGRTIKYGEWLIPKLDRKKAKETYCKLNK